MQLVSSKYNETSDWAPNSIPNRDQHKGTRHDIIVATMIQFAFSRQKISFLESFGINRIKSRRWKAKQMHSHIYDKEARQSRAGHERPQRTWIGELTVG